MRNPLLIACAIPFALTAQTPTVTAVLNPRAATAFNVNDYESAEAGLTPGGPANIYGSHFSENAVVLVGGRKAAILQYHPPSEEDLEVLRVQLPVDAAPETNTLVVTTAAGTSAPFRVLLQAYAPSLSQGVIRRHAPEEHAPPPLACFPQPISAVPGEVVTVYGTGLGPTDPQLPTGVTANFGLPSTVTKPTILVGGREVEVVESVLAPEEYGVYRVSFRVPAGEGGLEIVLSIGGKRSNGIFMPVGRAFQNLSSSFGTRPAAAESIRVAYACGHPLTNVGPPGFYPSTPDTIFVAEPRNPANSLGGTTVTVTDAHGERPAGLLYASPSQVNYIMPRDTSNGYARVKITTGAGTEIWGTVRVQSAAPELFTVATNRGPLPVGAVVRLRNGRVVVEPLTQPGTAFQKDPVPIGLGPETDELWLVLGGTGFRNRSSLGNVRVTIGGVEAPVDYAGPQPPFAGQDQLNVRLPRSLAGRGLVTLRMIADGADANAVFLVFQDASSQGNPQARAARPRERHGLLE